MLLFPYYRHAGPDDSYARTEAVMEKRRMASGELEDLQAERDKLQSELDQFNDSNLGVEQKISALKTKLNDINTHH